MFLRLFDVNFDGFIDKKEFRWMTTSELVSWKTIDLVFEVRTIFWGGNFSPWISQMNGCLRRQGRAMPSEHILIWDDLQYAKGGNDQQYAGQRGGWIAMHRCGAGAGSGHIGHPQMEKLQNWSTFPPNNCTAVKQLLLARDATWTETESWTTRSSERWFSGVGRGKKLSSGRSKNRQAKPQLKEPHSCSFQWWHLHFSRVDIDDQDSNIQSVSGQVEREAKVSWEKEEEGANKQEKGEKGEKGRKKEEVKRSLPSNCCTQYKKHSEIKHTKRISLKRVIGRLFVLTHVETFILIFDCQFLSNHLIKMYFWRSVYDLITRPRSYHCSGSRRFHRRPLTAADPFMR